MPDLVFNQITGRSGHRGTFQLGSHPRKACKSLALTKCLLGKFQGKIYNVCLPISTQSAPVRMSSGVHFWDVKFGLLLGMLTMSP